MRIDVEWWHVASLIASVIAGFWAVGRLLMAANQRAIDEKFQAIAKGMETQDASSRQLERDLMALRAELPRDYVRREDYTQAIATIMTKIDAVALQVERAIREAYRAAMKAGGTGDPK